jgi:hypothetical protein
MSFFMDSGFVGCDAASLDEWFLTLQMNVWVFSFNFTIHGPLTLEDEGNALL